MISDLLLGSLISAALCLLILFLKVRPRCASCSSKDREIGMLAATVSSVKQMAQLAGEDRDRQISSMQQLLDRVMVNAGIVKPVKSADEIARERAQREAEEADLKRRAKIESEGGAVYGD